VEAIVFRLSLAKYALAKALGTLWPRVYLSRLSLVQRAQVAEPKLPGQEWVKIRPRLAGICGTDIRTITLQESPLLSAFTSFPFVLGHENVGVVAEAGAESGFFEGERVTAEPLLSCRARGCASLCSACERGEPTHCQCFDQGRISPGLQIGACASTGGSWSEAFVAHRSQVHRVPATLSDADALLVEPLSCSLRAVGNNPPTPGQTVLIIGAGIMGLTTLIALRQLGPPCTAIALARYPFQAELAKRHGADHVLLSRDQSSQQALQALLQERTRKTAVGQPVLVSGGADVVYDCVGSARSLQLAVAHARSGGRVVLVGTASSAPGADWAHIWLREVSIGGSVFAGSIPWGNGREPCFALALGLAAEGRARLGTLLSRTYPLSEWRTAVWHAMHKAGTQAVKLAFEIPPR
jgi:threonine dehydrogenase-like Zn-dependent dehydrogenase